MKISANWIRSPIDTDAAVITFCRDFSPCKRVKRATLFASALGVYVPFINGNRVGKNVLAPGWTSYLNRIQYQTYDVTDLLTENTHLAIGVGPGWAVGNIGCQRNRNAFGKQTAVIAQLDVLYTDGTKERLATDTDWEVYTSAVTFSDIYNGETIDMTAPIERLGNATSAQLKTKLLAQVGEDIIEHERLAPIACFRTPKGELVLDFGQNMTGYVELSITAPRGSRIVIHHAEILDKEGNFYTANYRRARNELTFITSGGNDLFKPMYSFQGFRYIQLVEYPFETVDTNAFRAVVVHSDIKRTGSFRCGNEKINQLYHNIIWGQKGNYLDIPTDCPQRDERLGWTGDTQVFCRTGAINYDVEKFFEKWLGDVALDQEANGAVRGVIPIIPGLTTSISAAWGDAACVVPWEIYCAYGNKKILEKNLPTMKKWVEYMHSAGPEEFLWLGGIHYGDWLAMDAGGDSCIGATSCDLIASAFFAYSTNLLVRAGEILGKDMTEYRTLYRNVRNAFRAYFMENGMPKEGVVDVIPNAQQKIVKNVTQTAIVLILHFGLCTEEERGALTDKLCELIHDFGDRMTTGFVGTPYILHALTDNGRSDVAYKLLVQEKNPSWLYSVDHGATTIWEHWNGMKEDGSFWSTDMNSFNHYAYGAVCDWLFGCACGIKPTAPAYKTVKIAPHPSRVLGSAQYCIDTVNGRLISKWYYRGEDIRYEIEIPEGVCAEVVLPDGKTYNVGAGEYVFYSKA